MNWTSIAGLFSRAIAQSGCALNPWAFNTRLEARRKAFRFGEALSCKTNDSKELAEFLNTVPAEQLVDGVPQAMTEQVEKKQNSYRNWSFKLFVQLYSRNMEPPPPKLEHFEHIKSNLAT